MIVVKFIYFYLLIFAFVSILIQLIVLSKEQPSLRIIFGRFGVEKVAVWRSLRWRRGILHED
jgi:hypothetical protein